MKTGNSKLALGLIVGAAVGAAAVYLMNKDNRESVLGQINDTIDCAKKKIGNTIGRGMTNTDLEAGNE